MKYTRKYISIVLTLTICFSDIVIPVVSARTLYDSRVEQAAPKEETFKPAEQKTKTTRETAGDASPEVLGLADMGFAESSASQRLPVKVQKMEKKTYGAEEDVTIAVSNPEGESIQTKVIDDKGQEIAVHVEQIDKATTSELHISATNQFKPGKYTVVVTDAEGKQTKQDFTWGVLAFNTDKAVYAPKENAFISMAVLDEKGAMVCDADVELIISNPSNPSQMTLSTQNGKIIVNQECRSTDVVLKPDYEANYTVGEAGTYAVKLTANTGNGTYTITDSFEVKETTDFVIKRDSATRLYPPNAYPMNIEITANRDFTGVITETVPESFTITPADENNSYDAMDTMYLQGTNPEAKLEQKVLGDTDSILEMPFNGIYTISQGFGFELTDLPLKDFYSHHGLAGHDGVDFALPTGTPLFAVDGGTVLQAGEGDYGITVIVQHAWGRSYYGHLSKTTATEGMQISKGSHIGYSGNTGESTGPHLHFGIKPNTPDLNNGYAGKIDPMPFLPKEGRLPGTQVLSLGEQTAVLAASTSGEASASAQTSVIATPQSGEAIPAGTEIEQEIAASTSAEQDFTVANEVIQEEVKDSENPVVDRVKVIQWQVSVKKGEKMTLSYKYKAPMVSPQFYTVGPLKFFEDKSQETVYEEGRRWQIAADAINIDWYDAHWGYRKPITIDKDQVGGGSSYADAWCNDVTGITCTSAGWTARRKITFDNSDSGTNLTNFPVLVKLNSSRIDYTKTQPDGDDIRFVDASDPNTVLPHEIEEWNESGDSYVWVRVPQINSGSTTDYIMMYYNNASATSGQDATTVWSNSYNTVWHLEESGSTFDNSVGSSYDGSAGGGLPSQTAGLSSYGQDFNWNNDEWIGVSHSDGSLIEPANITASLWTKFSSEANSDRSLLSKRASTAYAIQQDVGTNEFIWNIRVANTDRTIAYNYSSVPIMNDGNWHLLTGTYNGSSVAFYVDGALVSSTAVSGSITYGSTNDLMIGADAGTGTSPDTNTWYHGQIDEVRISSTGRTADWIEAEFISGRDTMNTYGAEEFTGSAPSLTNFPVLINLTSDANLAATTASGNEILFTDSTGKTKLSHEIESYNSGTGALVAWVEIPTLTDAADVEIYMYYGNSGVANQEDPTNVWDSDYRAVWNMSEGSGTAANDSTSFANNLTASNSWNASGKIGTAWNGATNLRLSRADDADFDFAGADNLSIGMWFKSDAADNTATQYLLNKADAEPGYAIYSTSADVVCFGIDDDTTWTPDDEVCSSADVYDTAWHYLYATKTGTSAIELFIDGSPVGSNTSIVTGTLANADIFYMGDRQATDGTDEFLGDIDQVSISRVVRADEWIGTEYTNQNSPSTFYAVGSQETRLSTTPLNKLMRHGKFFDNRLAEQPFVF
jgi:murein DD-endopeptidase MepM/ murein hydrolase activator NlpD